MKPVLSFGRIMLGLAYVVYGYLHFAHTAADAAMVPQGVGRPVVWVILIGICWWAVALSFFTNILTRLSGVLASVLLFFVLFFAILCHHEGFPHRKLRCHRIDMLFPAVAPTSSPATGTSLHPCAQR